jgi:TolA-binding protein
MATERWTDDMLDRFVGSVNTLAGVSDQNTRAIGCLEGSVESLVNVSHAIITELQRQGVQVREIQNEIREMRVDIREMQAEVRGLQTENRRILDQFINRNDENG